MMAHTLCTVPFLSHGCRKMILHIPCTVPLFSRGGISWIHYPSEEWWHCLRQGPQRSAVVKGCHSYPIHSLHCLQSPLQDSVQHHLQTFLEGLLPPNPLGLRIWVQTLPHTPCFYCGGKWKILYTLYSGA